MDSRRYKEIVRALFSLTKTMNSGVDQPTFLHTLAKKAAELLRADSCSIFLLEEGTDSLLSHGAYGLSAQEEVVTRFARGEGVAGWVAQHGAPALIADVTKDARYVHLPQQNLEIISLLCVPLRVLAHVLGVITVTSKRKKAFSKDDEELLEFLGNSAVRDLENARLYQMSITDPLTKCFNRQYLLHRLPDEVERYRRYGDPFSVVLLDLDHFKKVNDTHGHLCGDFVLREVTRLIKEDLREIDALVRYGGDEFLFLLPRTECTGAHHIAERVRAHIEKIHFHYSDATIFITASLGVSQFQMGQTEADLIAQIDQLLYQAKNKGRNCVVVAR